MPPPPTILYTTLRRRKKECQQKSRQNPWRNPDASLQTARRFLKETLKTFKGKSKKNTNAKHLKDLVKPSKMRPKIDSKSTPEASPKRVPKKEPNFTSLWGAPGAQSDPKREPQISKKRSRRNFFQCQKTHWFSDAFFLRFERSRGAWNLTNRAKTLYYHTKSRCPPFLKNRFVFYK